MVPSIWGLGFGHNLICLLPPFFAQENQLIESFRSDSVVIGGMKKKQQSFAIA